MQGFFNSALCLTLVMTSALADGYRNSPGAYGASGWRPINPPAVDQPPYTSTPADDSFRQPMPYGNNGGQAPGYNPVQAGSGPYGGQPAYDPVSEPPPYGYGYGEQETYTPSPYLYPPADNPNAWGYPADPGYYQAPSYGYPYQDGAAPGYSPYETAPNYGYQPGYDQGYYDPTAPAPNYGNGYYPDDENRGFANPYGTAPRPQVQGYPSTPPYSALEGRQATDPGYDYGQLPTYPSPQAQPPQPYSFPAGPDATPPSDTTPPPGTGATRYPPVPPAATQPGGYRVNGAPAVFRPWTDPGDDPTTDQTDQ